MMHWFTAWVLVGACWTLPCVDEIMIEEAREKIRLKGFQPTCFFAALVLVVSLAILLWPLTLAMTIFCWDDVE